MKFVNRVKDNDANLGQVGRKVNHWSLHHGCPLGLSMTACPQSFQPFVEVSGSCRQFARKTLMGQGAVRISFQTSFSMLFPATIHRASSKTKMLAAWRGFHGVLGTSCHLTPSEEYHTSLRLPLIWS